MAIDLTQFTRCVHCRANVPKGRFCVRCERPLLQSCPAERGELVVPLLSDAGRPTAQCPQCGVPFKTCPVCRRLYEIKDTRCAADGAVLCPTTALDDGDGGGSPRNPARVWYAANLEAPAMQTLPNLPAGVERAAYAAGRLIISTQSAAAGRRLFAYPLADGQADRPENSAIPGAAPADLRNSLTLSGRHIGVLSAQSAALYDNAPLQFRYDIALPSAPLWQVFTQTHWFLLTEAGGGMAQIHVCDLKTGLSSPIPTQTAVKSIFQVLSAAGRVILACHNGEIHAFGADGSHQTAALPAESKLLGAAATETGVTLLSSAAGYVNFDRWNTAGSRERIGFIAAPDPVLSGFIAAPQALYFHSPRALYAYRLTEQELLTETLPAAAEIMLANVVTSGDAEHLFARQHTANSGKWEIWTPAIAGSRRSVGVPFVTRTLSGLTDAGYYLIVPSANVMGGSNQCEMRLWQFG